MKPVLFITYMLLLEDVRGTKYSTKHMMEYRRSEDPAIRVAYQMLVLDAIKKCKNIEGVVGIDKILELPEEWDTFIDAHKGN